MARIDPPTRDQIKEELRNIFDEVSAPPGGVGTGPMSALKHSPEMSRRAIPLFNYVRNESSLPSKIRELAMIVTARATDCQYIWNVHAPAGRREGLSDALVDALKNKHPLPPMSARRTSCGEPGTGVFQHPPRKPRKFPTGLGAIRDAGIGGTDHIDGVLCDAGLQRQHRCFGPSGGTCGAFDAHITGHNRGIFFSRKRLGRGRRRLLCLQPSPRHRRRRRNGRSQGNGRQPGPSLQSS